MLTKAGAKLLDFGLAKLLPTGSTCGVNVSAAPTASDGPGVYVPSGRLLWSGRGRSSPFAYNPHQLAADSSSMETHSVGAIVRALNSANVRYLVAGGLAVVAHGYVRFTADVDLIVGLEQTNATRAIAALESLGYRPRAPVPFADFADSQKRALWVRDQNLTVFSVYSPHHPLTEVDLFVEPPLDFDVAYQRAVRKEIAPGLAATFVGIGDLRHLKRLAGRPQDLLDLEKLPASDTERVDE
jgi:hypothetical protein